MEYIQDNMNSTGEGSDLHGSATEKSNITGDGVDCQKKWDIIQPIDFTLSYYIACVSKSIVYIYDM